MAFPTKKQQEILDILDKNIVVSASAGSGKTSIMIERIANFISNFQVPIKEMLVVTFTNSAAAEMKERLVNKLAQKIEEEKDYSKKAFLISQAEDIDSANICTIDKFCISILQKYYYLLGLDGNFNIIEDIENEKLKNRAFDNAIKKLRKENPILIDELCDAFLEHRQTTKLKELADKILFYLSVQEDRVEYLQKTLFCLYTLPIEKNSIYANAIAKVADVVEHNSYTFERYIDLNIEHVKTANLLQLYKKFFNDFKNAKLNEKHAIISSFAVIKLGNKKAENPDEIKQSIYAIETALNEYKDIFNPQFTLKELEEQLKNSKILIEKLMQFVTLYEKNLLDYKKENNSFTFADIEYFAYEILKKDEVKNTLTDEISLIFVDEYQDVNKLQEHLISQIAKKNNLFLVGDIKQSIYGFRLSDPRFFEQKLIEYASKENIYTFIIFSSIIGSFAFGTGVEFVHNPVIVPSSELEIIQINESKNPLFLQSFSELLDFYFTPCSLSMIYSMTNLISMVSERDYDLYIDDDVRAKGTFLNIAFDFIYPYSVKALRKMQNNVSLLEGIGVPIRLIKYEENIYFNNPLICSFENFKPMYLQLENFGIWAISNTGDENGVLITRTVLYWLNQINTTISKFINHDLKKILPHTIIPIIQMKYLS